MYVFKFSDLVKFFINSSVKFDTGSIDKWANDSPEFIALRLFKLGLGIIIANHLFVQIIPRYTGKLVDQ